MTYMFVTRDGEKEEFDEKKAYCSIYYPAREQEYTHDEACDFADAVFAELEDWMDEQDEDVFTSKEIRRKIYELLQEHDESVAFLYETHLDIN